MFHYFRTYLLSRWKVYLPAKNVTFITNRSLFADKIWYRSRVGENIGKRIFETAKNKKLYKACKYSMRNRSLRITSSRIGEKLAKSHNGHVASARSGRSRIATFVWALLHIVAIYSIYIYKCAIRMPWQMEYKRSGTTRDFIRGVITSIYALTISRALRNDFDKFNGTCTHCMKVHVPVALLTQLRSLRFFLHFD